MFKFLFLFIFCFGASAASLDEQKLEAKEAWHVVYEALRANKNWALKTRSEEPAYYNGQFINFGISNAAYLTQINNSVLTSIYENKGDGFLNALVAMGQLASGGISGRLIKKYLFAIEKLLKIAEPYEYKSLVASLQGKSCEPFLYADQKEAAYAKVVDGLGKSHD